MVPYSAQGTLCVLKVRVGTFSCTRMSGLVAGAVGLLVSDL